MLWDDVRTNKPLQIGGTRYLHLDGRSRPVGGDGAWSEPTDDPWGNESDDSARVGMRGELAAAGLVWMGARVYDPSSREFLSPDPLPPVPGRPGYAGLYSYGFLNPVNHLDPSGLRPVSQADYDKIRTAEEQGRFGQAWQAIKDDPWGTLAMVAVTAVGVALVATGVGTAIGAGILIGVAASAAMGVATGTFSPRGVAISGAIGAIPGGSTLRGAMLVGAAGGFAGSVATDVAEGRPVNLEAAGISTVLGAGGGAAAHGIATHLGGARPTIEEPTTPTARFVVDGNGVTTDLQAPIAVSAGKPQLALPPGTGTNPWADGPVITSRVVGPGGENVNMAMAPGQPVPGGWSTPDHIPSVDYVRQDLAVTPIIQAAGQRRADLSRPRGREGPGRDRRPSDRGRRHLPGWRPPDPDPQLRRPLQAHSGRTATAHLLTCPRSTGSSGCRDRRPWRGGTAGRRSRSPTPRWSRARFRSSMVRAWPSSSTRPRSASASAVVFDADGSERFRLATEIQGRPVWFFQMYYVEDELTAVFGWRAGDWASVVDEATGAYLRTYETR